MKEKEIPFNRILIIDDSEVDFFIANSILKKHKPSVSLYYAMDVDSALNMLRSFKTSEVPDLILLDLNFERQSKQGLDFLKEFEKLYAGLDTQTKITVLTAFKGFQEAKVIARDFSHTAIMEKPFSVEKLISG